MATSVATPLIKQFETIPGISEISATNSLGNTSIVLQFDLNRNIDAAAADVQAAISHATRQLPDNLTTPPSYRKTNPADAPVMLLAVQSDTMPRSKLDEIAEDIISPSLSTLPGVAEVTVFGAQTYAVRVEVDPNKLLTRGIGIDTVNKAIAAANSQVPVGTLQNNSQSMTINADTQRTNAAGVPLAGHRQSRTARRSTSAMSPTCRTASRTRIPAAGMTASAASSSPSSASRMPTRSMSSTRSTPSCRGLARRNPVIRHHEGHERLPQSRSATPSPTSSSRCC